MFSLDRNNAVFDDVAITILARIDGSNLFYVTVDEENRKKNNRDD